jgi:hypothetical protein
MHYGGRTFDPVLDEERLNDQTIRIYRLMNDSKWRSLAEISDETGDPEASVSARLRDLRKDDFGAFVVNRRRRKPSSGQWEYQLQPPGSKPPVTPVAKAKRTGFLNGLMYAARILLKEPDLVSAKRKMKAELRKAAGL